jgi:hypothetical protein
MKIACKPFLRKKSFTKRTLKRESVKKVWQRNNIGHFSSTLFRKGLDPWIKGGGEKRTVSEKDKKW